MSLIIDSQLLPEKTNDYRLSIQADLNGFSFSVVDVVKRELLTLYTSDFVLGQSLPDDLSKKCSQLFKTIPHFSYNYKSTILLCNTHKYTLVPEKLYIKGNELKTLEKHHDIHELDEINTFSIPQEEMVIIYAVNSTFVNLLKRFQPKLEIRPIISLYLSLLPQYKEHNKLLVNYKNKVATIAGSLGEKIVYCNSFPAHHFSSMLYFLLLVLKEVQFNPETTTLYISGDIKDLEKNELTKYFSHVKYFRNPQIALASKHLEMKYSSLLFDI